LYAKKSQWTASRPNTATRNPAVPDTTRVHSGPQDESARQQKFLVLPAKQYLAFLDEYQPSFDPRRPGGVAVCIPHIDSMPKQLVARAKDDFSLG
jgi:hypothetical protein